MSTNGRAERVLTSRTFPIMVYPQSTIVYNSVVGYTTV